MVTATDDAPNSRVDWKALGVAPPEKYRTSDIRTLPWPRYEANGAGYTYAKHQPHLDERCRRLEREAAHPWRRR